MTKNDKLICKTIFISDVHLGTPDCKAEELLAFLKARSFTKLVLVGDIVDFWALSRRAYFPQAHVEVVRYLLKLAHKGVEVVWVTGNHDEVVRSFLPIWFGDRVRIVDEELHTTVDGRTFLCLHGDQFDTVIRHAKWLAFFGDYAYTFALRVNTRLAAIRRLLGRPYWSFSRWAKQQVKEAVNFIGHFEVEVAKLAVARGVSGIICGHIHHAELREVDNILYANCGDWVEGASAIIEGATGHLTLV